MWWTIYERHFAGCETNTASKEFRTVGTRIIFRRLALVCAALPTLAF